MHWTSGIELGIRLISWAWIRRLLDDWPKVGDLFEHNDDAVRQIGWHQEYLAAFPSRGSSANNHVDRRGGRPAGRGLRVPVVRRERRVARRAPRRCWSASSPPTPSQTGSTASWRPTTTASSLELGLVAAVEADAAGHPLSEATWTLPGPDARRRRRHGRRHRPTRRARATATRAARSCSTTRSATRGPALLATGAALLGARRLVAAGRPAACRRRCSRALGRAAPASRPAAERPRRFPDAGLVLLRSRTEDGPEIWCRCDGGPHGFLSIAAHAHADALSVEVRHDGVDILADPGTYCYHGEPEWRQWFRSTAAHNTLEIGGVEPVRVRRTVPVEHPGHERRRWRCDVGEQPVQTWSAEHDGYQRLNPPVTHRRSVTLDSPGRRLTVVDTLDDRRTGRVAVLRWQLGPDVQVELDGAHAALSWSVGGERRQGTLDPPERSSPGPATGASTDPIEGWYSPRFGSRVPATALVGRGTFAVTTRLVTELELP